MAQYGYERKKCIYNTYFGVMYVYVYVCIYIYTYLDGTYFGGFRIGAMMVVQSELLETG